MNAVIAAVLLAVVATCSGTAVTYSSIGGSQLYYPSAGYQYQYVQPSLQYVQQPVVSSSSVVSSHVPVNYASSAVIPSTSYVGLQYPYAYTYPYSYGSVGLLKK